MIIEEDSSEVVAGDAVFIPSNSNHGIKNIGDDVLEYLTANAPAISDQYESSLWPSAPSNSEGRLYPALSTERENHAPVQTQRWVRKEGENEVL